MKKLKVYILFLVGVVSIIPFEITQALQSTWIWYPGDYDIWLGNQIQNRRTERGTFLPPFWKMDSHFVLVEFSKKFDLQTGETITIKAEGKYNVKLDGKMLFGSPQQVTVPAGKHSLSIKVHNQAGVPAIYVNGKTIQSDNSWRVTYEDKEWIDESGKASDTSSGTVYLNAASWNFNSPDTPPSQFKLATQPTLAVSNEKKNNGTLYDFGKETFGYVRFNGLKGKGNLNIYYGESREEALSTDYCETLDRIPVDYPSAQDFTVSGSKAFRYVYVDSDSNLSFSSVSMLYEYLPLEYKGNFRCNDDQLNKIWEVAAYTLHLTTREFFIDGIKRDRWMWSGDAYQSYLMNYYLFFDSPSVTRTTFALRGKDPVTSHINTIMDYTFYWFMGVYDYYQYTGNKQLIEQLYPRIRNYWGGMIKLGATSFWEKYNPQEKNPELLAMYGRPFGKSLCHAWGASPIYLLGKYYLGVKPTSPGYQTYDIEPCLGDLLWMEGDVPTPNGKIHLYCSTKEIRVKSVEGTGTLRFKSLSNPVCKSAELKQTGDKQYEITILKGQEYMVKYQNIN